MTATLTQPQEALALANEVRQHRFQIRRSVRQREVSIRDLLAGPIYDNGHAAGMPVLELLCAAPHVGRSKAVRILDDAQIRSEHKTLGQLTPRQRRLLLDAVTTRPWMWQS